MSTLTSPTDVATVLLQKNGMRLVSLKVLQRLWAGYGYVCHVTATPFNDAAENSTGSSADNSGSSTPQTEQSFIVKLISPPPAKASDEGHIRKILSYQVEQYFYTHLAPRMPENIPVAKCFASINEQHVDGTAMTAMVLTDLRQAFPVAGEKRSVLSEKQVSAALNWLASFHGFWWDFAQNRVSLVKPPLEETKSRNESRTIWLNGGYTYLATRRKEFADLKADTDSEWCLPLTEPWENSICLAEVVAAVLAPNEHLSGPTDQYQTVIHGDVKSENLFTTKSGDQAVFYDFQYIGLGLGVCDLAKLFTCSVPLNMLVERDLQGSHSLDMQPGEKKLLQAYWEELQTTAGKSYDWELFNFHWKTALVDWLRFQASWGFWGNTAWLESRARCILADDGWRKALFDAHKSSQRGSK